MKWVIDTCGWVEFLTNGPLANDYNNYLRKSEECVVPTIVQYELYKWIRRYKGESKAGEIVAATTQGHVCELDTSLAIVAADVSLEHGLAMADALIYATALRYRIPLVTSDAHFLELPEVIFLKKP